MDIDPGGARHAVAALRAWLVSPGEPEPWVVETSGSTGRPKRVLLPRTAVLASVEASARRLGGAGAWVLALPAAYVAGVQVVARSLVAGHEPVPLDEHGSLAAAVAALPPGVDGFVSLVPTQLHRALADPDDTAALASLHTVLLGGGPIDPSLRERAAEAGVRVVATYGSAETAGGCVYDGVPLDGVGLALGPDGRIRLSGPTLFAGYDGDPALSAEVLVDGWFLTSDAGRLDDDGRLQVLGRLDDVVVTGGVNVPAPAVASRLREHPGVEAAEVLGVPDEEWGRRLVAFVVGAAGPVSLDELRAWVAERHPRSWAPRQVVDLDALPMLANGKPDRVALRAMVGARQGHAVGDHSTAPGADSTPLVTKRRRDVTGGVAEVLESHVFSIPMRTRFRGITVREGLLLRGPGGWGEWSPFLEYDATVAEPWLRCAEEAAAGDWPAPLRDTVPVNVTVPAVAPEAAHAIVLRGGCRTAKVKVAEPGQTLADDIARLEAVRDALDAGGPGGRVRIDVNGLWEVDTAVASIPVLDRAAGGLEYVEQPVATVEDLALVRRRVDVPIAADESIRRAADPYRVRDLEAADVAVLKVQPLGGVRACLRIAEDIGLPVVVSSALESSVGIAAGVALAAALPELPYACGLATVQLLTDDVADPALLPVDGALRVGRPAVAPAALDRLAAPPERVAHWEARLAEVRDVREDRRRG